MCECVCARALGGRCARLLLSAPHTVLRLEKLLAVFSVIEFSVTEGMSPADPHGIPGNMQEGPSAPSLQGGNTSLKAQVPRESCPGQAGPLCFLWSPAGQWRRDPGGLLGLEAASPPGCSLLSQPGPPLPLSAGADPRPPPPTPQVGKPILFQGLWQAPSQRFLREPVSDSCT